MVTRLEAIQLWEDHVGDSGRAPTDDELHAFALAVEEKARKPFVKLYKKWKRKQKEYESYAYNNVLGFSRYNVCMDIADKYEEFSKKLKNRLDAKN